MAGLVIRTETNGKITIARCEGFIDSETSGVIEETISGLVAKKNVKIILDLSKVDYVSSAGWGIFVGYIKDLRKAGGDLKIASMKREVMEIFELLDFTSIIEYYGDTESAARAFK